MGVVAIVGAQWGSEGKGTIAAALAPFVDVAVRVGGPNAGHSFYHRDTKYVMRGVPCAWVNPGVELVIGAGAVVDPLVLSAELESMPDIGVVLVDADAAVVRQEDHQAEREAGMWEAIGSTTEGVSVARVRKIARRAEDSPLASEYKRWHPKVHVLRDTAGLLYDHLRSGATVMLEGTQGSGLSLHHGTRWPFATSADTNVSGLLSDAGIAPQHVEHVFLVARTLPIRVAGNSGPMGEELSWDALREHAGVEVPEQTTVTKRVRRISRWFEPVFANAVRLNQPCGVFLTFADYLVPSMAGSTDADALMDAATDTPLGNLRTLVSLIEDMKGVPVVAFGTGGPRWSLAWRGRCAHGTDWSPVP